MKNKEFYKKLSDEVYQCTHPDVREMVKDLKITSLDQVLGMFRSVMLRNWQLMDDGVEMNKQIKKLKDVVGMVD